MNWGWTEQIWAGTVPLIIFFHGLVFFTLGMAILFAAPRTRGLEVIRRLPLLALFAFCEAGAAWDTVLALAISTPHFLPPILRTVLLALGYGSLMAFGLLTQFSHHRYVYLWLALPITLSLIWLFCTLFLTPDGYPLFWAEVTLRLGLALPGGILALWSMRSQTYRSIDPHILRLIRGSRRATGVALGLFGLLAGLVLPALSLLPRLWPAAGELTGRLTLPAITLLPLCGIAITYGLTRTMGVVHLEITRWIEQVEQGQALATERERIGRELHDGIIQSIYAAGLMLEGARQTLREDPQAAGAQIDRVMLGLNQTIQDVRRYIFDLRGQDPQADLVTGLEELLRDFRINTLLDTNLQVIGKDSHQLDVERRRHILQIAREALSNVARHAKARSVEVRLTYGQDLLLEIEDNGIGMSLIPTTPGQGLRNIRERARLLDGKVDIDSGPGQGVTVRLRVPYPKEGL